MTSLFVLYISIANSRRLFFVRPPPSIFCCKIHYFVCWDKCRINFGL